MVGPEIGIERRKEGMDGNQERHLLRKIRMWLLWERFRGLKSISRLTKARTWEVQIRLSYQINQLLLKWEYRLLKIKTQNCILA